MNHIPVLPRLPVMAYAPRQKGIYDIPQKKGLSHRAIKVYLLGALVWDYTETVLDLASQMRINETKKLARAVRTLRDDYDRLQRDSLMTDHLEHIRDLSILFERICRTHLERMCNGIRTDLGRYPDLSAEYRMLLIAVYSALTVLNALTIYGNECDAWIRKHGIHGNSILGTQLPRLAILLKEFAGDKYNPHIEACLITARILCNELKQIELV